MHICTQSGGLVEHIGLEKGYAASDNILAETGRCFRSRIQGTGK